MKTYKHLNKEERRVLAVLLQRGESIRSIARTLKRSHTSLSRELRRNLTQRHYHPLHAELIARLRHQQCHWKPRLKDQALKRQVASWIRKRWSPQIISGRLAQQMGQPLISHEAIYQWIYAEARHLIPFLPYHRRLRGLHRLDRSKGLILGRVSVLERPSAALLRQELGHWEADLLIGSGRSALKVAVERKTRLTRLRKVSDKSAQASYLALSRIFRSVPKRLRKSITYDNGLENAFHREINQRFALDSFFCFPHHPWEKPTVENTNGLIRWFLPKRTNLDTISDQKILEIEKWLNSRPRKCLGFQTPLEVLRNLSGALTG